MFSYHYKKYFHLWPLFCWHSTKSTHPTLLFYLVEMCTALKFRPETHPHKSHTTQHLDCLISTIPCCLLFSEGWRKELNDYMPTSNSKNFWLFIKTPLKQKILYILKIKCLSLLLHPSSTLNIFQLSDLSNPNLYFFFSHINTFTCMFLSVHTLDLNIINYACVWEKMSPLNIFI